MCVASGECKTSTGSNPNDSTPSKIRSPELEFRAATKALDLETSALSYQRVPPGCRFPYGHTQ